jgi:hypothetical protein
VSATSGSDGRSGPRSESAEGALPAREIAIAWGLLSALFALRILAAFRMEFDSDEPQHLHVVWGWTRGLLPYRDFFDNHAPLFHLLCAPLLAVVGERADALVLMRLALLPVTAAALACLWALGRRLVSPRAGLWGAVLAAFWPEHFLTSLEFRSDGLWAALWLATLLAWLGGRGSRLRAGSGGALAGAAAAVSLKTSLLLATLAPAALIVAGLTGHASRGARAEPAEDASRGARHGPQRAARAAGLILAGVAGFVVVPATLVALFAARGALGDLTYGAITHNLLPGLGRSGDTAARLPAFAALLASAGLAGWLAWRAGPRPTRAPRAILVLSAGLYVAALVTFWPLLTPQDYLPFEPVAALLIAALVVSAPPRPRKALLVAILAAESVALVRAARPWEDRAAPEIARIRDALRLTLPDEFVMDLKGETVFRRRPIYWVLEGVTVERLRRGLIPDRIPERLIATHTTVAVERSRWLPPRAAAFLDSQYVDVGHVRVLGQRLNSTGNGPITFHVAIPERFTILTAGKPAGGWLDGMPVAGPRFLAAGPHVYAPRGGERNLAAVWSRAVDSGYSPTP